jgi:hypothetical protein
MKGSGTDTEVFQVPRGIPKRLSRVERWYEKALDSLHGRFRHTGGVRGWTCGVG